MPPATPDKNWDTVAELSGNCPVAYTEPYNGFGMISGHHQDTVTAGVHGVITALSTGLVTAHGSCPVLLDQRLMPRYRIAASKHLRCLATSWSPSYR